MQSYPVPLHLIGIRSPTMLLFLFWTKTSGVGAGGVAALGGLQFRPS